MRIFSSFLLLIGRWCLAAIFLFAGVSKFFNFDQTAQYMASKGLTSIPLLLIAAAAVEIIGSLSLIFGYKTRFGALILLLFLIPTTYIFHDFWNATGADYVEQQANFFKNLAIFGGLLYVVCFGSGRWACDRYAHKIEAPEHKAH